MRTKPYLVFFLGPVLAYLAVLLVVGLYVTTPPALGWLGFGVVALLGVLAAGLAAYLYPLSRTNAERRHPRSDAPFRLLVVLDSDSDPKVLRRAVRRTLAGRSGEVLVVAPVISSPIRFLTDSDGEERAAAEARLGSAVQALRQAGIAAEGVLGSDDPLLAIGDALTAFPASGILLVAPEAARRGWLEHDLERKVRDVYGEHVTHVATLRLAV